MIDTIPIFLGLNLIIPFFTGFVAREYGRSFWNWFFLAMFLPIIAQVILFRLPEPPVAPARAEGDAAPPDA